MAMTNPVYALGHSERELARLQAQERLIGPVTRRFFRAAGIEAGMRVLDVGSGAGDTAFAVAELVGESGEVIGTDRAPAAIAAASRRARDLGLENVTFREGDPAEKAFERPFDAVVGRYVLLFQADPGAMVRGLLKRLRPGGVIAFHEPDLTCARSSPPAPTYDRFVRWLYDVFRLVDSEANMAGRLYRAFTSAGLAPTMRMETVIGGGAGCKDWLEAATALLGSMLPTVEQLGVATAAEVEIDTLAERMLREVTANGSLVLGRSEIAAWSRVEE
jgi:SAM-dependent methyltransferase